MGDPGVALVEVAFVLPGPDDGGLGGDVEAEEATADDGDGGDGVDVADLIHGGRQQCLYSRSMFPYALEPLGVVQSQLEAGKVGYLERTCPQPE